MEIDPLEALLNEALAHAGKGRKVKPLPTLSAKPKLPPSWQDPETWLYTHNVALIHKETNTLLGNFSEFSHPKLPGARQLRRVTEPCACDTTEVVSGDWWLTRGQEQKLTLARWVEIKEILAGITLREMGLHCAEAMVRVRLEQGGIDSVELVESTRFGCPARTTFLFLPKDLNVLPAMDLDSKIALRHALQREEEAGDAEEGE